MDRQIDVPALQIFKEDSLLLPNVECVTAHIVDLSRTRVARHVPQFRSAIRVGVFFRKLLHKRSMPQPDGNETTGSLSSVPLV